MVGVLRVFGMLRVFRMFGMLRMIGALAGRGLGGRFRFHHDPPAGGDERGAVSLAQLTKRVDFIVSVHTNSSAGRRNHWKGVRRQRRGLVGDASADQPEAGISHQFGNELG